MGSYSGTADRPDKAKAIGAVVAVHAALAFIILSGLNVRMIQETVDRMKTFNVEPQYEYLRTFQRHLTQAAVERPAITYRHDTLLREFDMWRRTGRLTGDSDAGGS